MNDNGYAGVVVRVTDELIAALEAARVWRGVTYAAMAATLGVDPSELCRILKGKHRRVRPRRWAALARYAGWTEEAVKQVLKT